MKIFSPMFILLGIASAFNPTLPHKPHFFPFKNELADSFDVNKIPENQPDVNTNLNLINNHNHFTDNIHHFIDENNKLIGKKVVLAISSLLPHVDSIGHRVLHANNEFISYILSHDILNDHLKKEIVLLSIRMAQAGDDFGSHLLQFYYEIVNSCL